MIKSIPSLSETHRCSSLYMTPLINTDVNWSSFWLRPEFGFVGSTYRPPTACLSLCCCSMLLSFLLFLFSVLFIFHLQQLCCVQPRTDPDSSASGPILPVPGVCAASLLHRLQESPSQTPPLPLPLPAAPHRTGLQAPIPGQTHSPATALLLTAHLEELRT